MTIILLAACKSQPVIEEEPPVVIIESEPEVIIEVKEPVFEIVSIVIIQADLVITQFEAVLKIDNPNDFALELSSLSYELFGNGFFWADGLENDILSIPAQSSLQTKFRFFMNFIGTNRRLLDDVIAMRKVQYRFAGRAQVLPVVPRVQPFIIDYDISGLSDVKPRAEN